MSKILDLAKKMKALADKGVGGEKANAVDMLEKIMEKHNLTMEDIEGEKKDHHYFKVSTKQEEIFWQVARSVIGKCESFINKKKPGYFIFELTALEAVELQMKYDFYWRLYEEEFEIFRAAFIQRNSIFHPDGKQIDPNDLSPKEREKAMRVIEMSQKIKNEVFRKQLKGAD